MYESRRVLVTYATRSGATEGIATAIAEELRSMGCEVDVLSVDAAPDPTRYDAVLLGSAIYYGQWRKEALRYGDEHAAELRQRPVWLFDSGPLHPSSELGPNEPVAAAEELARHLNARGRTSFGGRLLREDAGFLVRHLMASGRAGGYGDFRDMPRVRAWARRIGEELGADAGRTPAAPAAVAP